MSRRLVVAQRILTGGGEPGATALALEDGRVVGTGRAEDFQTWAGPTTAVTRFPEHVVSPGFVESHAHLLWMGQVRHFVDCSTPPHATVADILARIRQEADRVPAGSWIIGFHYDEGLLAEGRPPTLDELTAAAPTHPVYITHNSGHLAITNRLALERARLTDDQHTPGVMHDAAGHLTGVLREAAALDLVSRHLPVPSLDDKVRFIGEASQAAWAVGTTAMTDAAMGLARPDATQADWAAYQAAEERGVLGVRTVCYARAPETTSWVPAPYCTPWLQAGGVKLFADGSIQGHTGALSAPYHDSPSEHGMLLYDVPTLAHVMNGHHRAGRQILIHCNGDAAIELALDAFAAVLPPRPHPYRHRIEHAQMATRAQLERMAALGVWPSFFVGHVHHYGDRHHDRYLGPERGRRISPVQEAVEAGLLFSLHSDCPVTPLDPLHSMRVAVERKTQGGRTLGPAQRVRAETAFLAYTRWAAYLGLREQSIGSLDPGRLADFTVLDGNPLDWRPNGDNPPVRVLSTWTGGEERVRR